MDLIQLLIKNLGVNEGQAKGGLGLILGLLKNKLGGTDFSKIVALIPESDDLIRQAPDADDSGASILGKVTGLVSSLSGKGSGLGSLAGLVGGFSNLGLDPDMIGQFASTATGFMKEKGDDQISGLLDGVLGSDND